ncbi:MAG: LysR family transcriptional regulator [Christensenellales bacterium]
MCAENVWTRNRFVFFLKSRGREALPRSQKLFISRPGLVKSMDKLEDELGAPLFVRQRTGVCLSLPDARWNRWPRPICARPRRFARR